MAKDPNEKIRKQIRKLASKKADLLKDKFKTDDAGLRKIWDAEIKKIDAEMFRLHTKLE